MTNLIQLCVLSVFIGSIACGGSSGKNGGNSNPTQSDYVNWKLVPDKFNPTIDEVEFSTTGLKTASVNLFGFNQDFRIEYTNSMAAGKGTLKHYSVSHGDIKYGIATVEMKYENDNLKFFRQGGYECGIQVKNGDISSLNGACYVRIVLTLPIGTEVEVYNAGVLVSARFHAIDNETFLSELEKASFAQDKFVVIDDYLESYRATAKKPALRTNEVSLVLSSFAFKQDKLDALKLLHKYVIDRANLEHMINDNFNTFDRDEARKIVGLD